VTRLRSIGGRPVVLQHSYAPGRLRDELPHFDGTESLYAFLRHWAGLVAGGYHETVTAESTSVAVAEILDLDSGAPILVARRITTTGSGHPFLYDEAFLPSERVTVAITRRGAGTSVAVSPRIAMPTETMPADGAATN
jgi:GntR family transcriptional regulator